MWLVIRLHHKSFCTAIVHLAVLTHTLFCPQAEASLVPQLQTQHEAWVEGRKCDACSDDHWPLEDHEGEFVIGQFPIKPVLELGETVARSSHDGNDGSCNSYEKSVSVHWIAGG